MAHAIGRVIVIDDDQDLLPVFATILLRAGFEVFTSASGTEGLRLFGLHPIDVAIVDLRLPDISGLELLTTIRAQHIDIPFIVVTGFGTTKQAVDAMRLGAADFLEKPVLAEELLRTVRRALRTGRGACQSDMVADRIPDHEAHAAARWARALLPIIEAPKDPRTVARWSRWVAASPGALRNWCRTAGISPRRSLVFGRLVRAIVLNGDGCNKPTNLLDVVDRRTLHSLLVFAGFDGEQDFPKDHHEFLERQRLVRDPDALREFSRLLNMYLSRSTTATPLGPRH